MKTYYFLLIGLICLVACQPQTNNKSDVAMEAFKRNSETVRTDIENWQNETPDYSTFAEDIILDLLIRSIFLKKIISLP